MRKAIAFALATALGAFVISSSALAAGKTPTAKQGGSITGTAQNEKKQPLANYTVRLRDASTGNIVGSTTTNAAGSFTFQGLPPGNYIVEVVDSAGKVVGLSPSISVSTNATMNVTITASVIGAIGGASSGGFSLFGLGALASVAVIGGAGALTTVGVMAARGDSSPSK